MFKNSSNLQYQTHGYKSSSNIAYPEHTSSRNNLYNNRTNGYYNPQHGFMNANKINGFQNFDIRDSSLQFAIQKLINENKLLNSKLQEQKQKNYQLLELKRRLEQDINRLEFQLDRIANYQSISNKQCQIKNYQTLQDNNKLQAQLDQYFQQNKKIRAQMRKYASQCEKLGKQKDDLINQNIILLNQIADIKQKLVHSQKQIVSMNQQMKRRNNIQENVHAHPSIHDIVTIRSINQKSNHQHHQSNQSINLNQQNKLYTLNSPQSLQSLTLNSPQNRSAQDHKLFFRQQVSTNPSEQKINLSSPNLGSSKYQDQRTNYKFNNCEKIYEDFYEDHPEPSPRSFNNQIIQHRLDFASPIRGQAMHTLNYSGSNQQINKLKSQISDKKSPSVISYAHRQSPMLEQLKFCPTSNSGHQQIVNQKYQETNSHRNFLKTFQKKQLKQQVQSLRNELIDDLIAKYYNQSLQKAEQLKSNSLKIFIKQLKPKLHTLQQMIMNYFEARQMLAESCPTLRLKWQPINPLTNPSYLNEAPSNSSELMMKNTLNLSTIYNSIKANAKKQKTLAGQYLALFRYLTLLNKIQMQDVDPLLIQCIKHSALKQIHRINSSNTQNQVQDQLYKQRQQ